MNRSMVWNNKRKRYQSRRVVSNWYTVFTGTRGMPTVEVPTLLRAMRDLKRIGSGMIITPCQSIIEYEADYGFKIVYPVGNMDDYRGIIPIS